MQVEAGVLVQPLLHVGVLVSAVVVQDQVDVQALGNLSVDGAQELQELLGGGRGSGCARSMPSNAFNAANRWWCRCTCRRRSSSRPAP